jgi:hypothetical protein
MGEVFVIGYAHIDSTHMIIPEVAEKGLREDWFLPCTREEALFAFKKAGWEGDGRLGFIWLPPFLFEDNTDTWGVCLWHVKQSNNGTSWLCARKPYDFPGLANNGFYQWERIELPEKLPLGKVAETN